MKTDTLFCEKTDKGYKHFYFHNACVKMCGVDEKDIVKVQVTESKQGDYYGWWNKKDQVISMIYPDIELVEMCFAYGTEIEEVEGRGLLLRLKVEEIT